MRLPWSKGDKKVDLEPTTGNDVVDETAIEKKLGLSSVGTYAPSPLLNFGVKLMTGSLQVEQPFSPMGKSLCRDIRY